MQLEVGGMYAATSLRMQTTSAVVPRVAGEGIFAFMGKRVGLSIRLGYQYAVWGNAGMSGERCGTWYTSVSASARRSTRPARSA